MQFLKNPFYLYVFSFFLIIVLYQLGWSELYPILSFETITFFLISFIISFFLGAVIDKYLKITYKKADGEFNVGRTLVYIYIFYFIEFIYNKGIPIILVFTDVNYEYSKFGIPTLHPIFTTFVSFFAVYLFHLVISKRSYRNGFYLLMVMLIPIIIYNRGMLLIMLSSFLFVFLMSIKRIKIKVFLYITIVLLLVFYGFGILGNYRMVHKRSNDYFMETSRATKKFEESSIPKEYLWSYMYICSPLANLQNNIDINPGINYHYKSFLFAELLPDFISKRLVEILDVERLNSPLVAKWLTVGTVFSRSYSALGWLGMILMFLFLSIGSFIYLLLLKKDNDFYVTGVAILNTFIIYNTFSNMIYFSGISLQLIFPLMFMYIKKIKFVSFKYNGE